MHLDDGKIILSSSNLKALRRRYGLSQESMAYKCSEENLAVSIATVKRAEAGKKVSYGTAYKIAKFYDVDISELTNNSVSPPFLTNIPFKSQNENSRKGFFTNKDDDSVLDRLLLILKDTISIQKQTLVIIILGEDNNKKTKLLQKFSSEALQMELDTHYVCAQTDNISLFLNKLINSFGANVEFGNKTSIENQDFTKRTVICIDNYNDNLKNIFVQLSLLNNLTSVPSMFVFSTVQENQTALIEWAFSNPDWFVSAFNC